MAKIGKTGGINRMKSLTPDQRRELALKAIYARWRNKKQNSQGENK